MTATLGVAPASLATELRCDEHGHRVSLERPATVCPRCGSLLEISYDLDRAPADLFERATRERALGMWRWRALLPLPAGADPVSLGEGDTPLLSVPDLGRRLGLGRLWLKNDALMPTGSFKDRGFALAVSMARHYGLTRGFTYSSGNAGASFAAYAARAGLRATVFVEWLANETKVAAISLYGARVFRLHYNSSAQIFAALDELARQGEYSFVNFVNPVRHEAMKTYAYEIVEQLGGAVPDVMVHPVGTGGGLWGAWKGFGELRALGVIDRVPRMIGVQPAVCAPIVDAFEHGRAESRTVGDASATMAQSIAGDSMIHGGRRLLRAMRESGGGAIGVSEDDLAEAIRLLGTEAVAAEPSAAASLAGLLHARERGLIDPGESVVAVVTGSALKQPGVLAKVAPAPVGEVRADAAEWLAALAGSAAGG
ncbi:MAG TPA: threonine synthase [Pseudonocardiaceae bacterium]|nr:threonine synthase [Pseudonocardiaceae bacterium]